MKKAIGMTIGVTAGYFIAPKLSAMVVSPGAKAAINIGVLVLTGLAGMWAAHKIGG